MKIVGLIGGMSWESTRIYYEEMNREVQRRRGKHHSVEAILYSVDFERILEWVEGDRWDLIGEEMAHLGGKLERAGAGLLLLTSNAIHKVFERVQEGVKIPVLHIADPTGEAVMRRGMKRVALLGTRVTMEEPFYRERLEARYGLEVVLPEAVERERLHRIIFDELTIGRVEERSQRWLRELIEKMSEGGQVGVILGCTELTLLVEERELGVPLFDTTALHAQGAVEWTFQV